MKDSEKPADFGARLRWLRRKFGQSLEEFGGRVHYGQSYLSKLERGKNENPSEQLLYAICHVYGVRREWLSQGQGRPFASRRVSAGEDVLALPLPSGLTLDDKGKELGLFVGCTLFGANQKTDEDLAGALLDLLTNPLPLQSVTLEAARILAENLYPRLLHKAQRTAKPGDVTGIHAILARSKIARLSYEALLGEAGVTDPNISKRDLTVSESSSKSVAVKAQLPGLLEELKKATAEAGKKTALADFLDVPLASVSRWLAGERRPGGEYVLQMQKWLERASK